MKRLTTGSTAKRGGKRLLPHHQPGLRRGAGRSRRRREAEIHQAVAAAKEAFPKWANLPMKERARLMRRPGDLIDQNVPDIAAMETADTGLPIHQTKTCLSPRLAQL